MIRFTHIFILIAIFTSCTNIVPIQIVGNGQMVNKEMQISDYSEIVLNNTADIIYEQKNIKQPYLQIYIDENLLPELDVRLVGNQLIIASKQGKKLAPSQFKIYTNSQHLKKVQSNGTGNVHLKGEINAPKMEIEIQGTGSVISDSLYCENLKVNVSGTGNSLLAGVADKAIFCISGTGDIKAPNYFVQRLQATSSGTGHMEVQVLESLNVNILGTGDVIYRGEPSTVKKSITGTGQIVHQK